MWGIDSAKTFKELSTVVALAVKRLFSQINTLESSISTATSNVAVPVGSVTMWAAATAPTSYLLCNGAAISRTTNAALFSVIGTTYGVGDGSTTFNLPNFTGLVPRMPGTQAISGRNKVGPALGTTQEDQMQKITGSVTFNGLFSGDSTPTSGAINVVAGANFSNTAIGASNRTRTILNIDSATSPNARASATTDGETRISSLGINFIIKAV